MRCSIIHKIKFRRNFDSRVKRLTKALKPCKETLFLVITHKLDVGSLATEKQQLSETGVSKLRMVNMT